MPSGPLPVITPPSLADVEAWCARASKEPFARCVEARAATVLGSPLVLSDPSWLRSGSHAAACADGRNAIVCDQGARVTCTEGMVVDVIACAKMDMVCSPNAAGVGECVRAACFVGARMQCFDGFLDSCNDTKSETTRHRCPSNVPCRDDGAGSFTCKPAPACDQASCEAGVARVCVAGVPRTVQCKDAGWGCPPNGVLGLPPPPCTLPTDGPPCKDDVATCEGTTLRYCLGGHLRTTDCALISKECREDVAIGAHCAE
jgi:hypothetical protein